jgi:Ca2+/Na+ antiporter
MGLTILAVGSSIEEIFSAIVMTRRGHPEMAIAGSIGSNVFDILMGLGIPWLFRNLMRFTYQLPPLETGSLMVDSALVPPPVSLPIHESSNPNILCGDTFERISLFNSCPFYCTYYIPINILY